ncbi:Ig-like domain-containing protein [Streptomyces sp. NPDC002577]
MRLPAALALTVLVFAAMPQPLAEADYASVCAAPTRTISGGSSDLISVAAGETVLLTNGEYTGGLAALPAGAVLCVDDSASFAPAWANSPAGTLAVQGTATLGFIPVASGFTLENAGTTQTAGFNAAGTLTVNNEPGATLNYDNGLSLRDGSLLHNEGTVTTGSISVSSDSTVTNDGSLTTGVLTLSGTVSNRGTLTIQGPINETSSTAVVDNQCLMDIDGSWGNVGTVTNSGVITLTDWLGNIESGSIRQTAAGVISGSSFDNDSTVTGFGGFRFTGQTETSGTFAGDSSSDPIRFYDTTPVTGGIFDYYSGTVENVVRAEVTVDPDHVPAGCVSSQPENTADLSVTKQGPAEVAAGGQVTYVVTVSNSGPDTATAVTVHDNLPAELTDVTASDGGTVSGTTVTWDVGDLAAGDSIQLTVTGTAPESGTLTDTVSGTTTATDPDPANNNGTSDAARVTTVVTPSSPNRPPVVDDVTVSTVENTPVSGNVPVSDPDGDALTVSLSSPPANGTVTVDDDGHFVYTPNDGFTGTDTFTVTACDNGTPQLCDTGTVTIHVTGSSPSPSPSPSPSTPSPTGTPTATAGPTLTASPTHTAGTPLPTNRPPHQGGSGKERDSLPATGADFPAALFAVLLLAGCGVAVLITARRMRKG